MRYTAGRDTGNNSAKSLACELGAFGLRAELVEPGCAPTTRFGQNSGIAVQYLIPEAYGGFEQAGPCRNQLRLHRAKGDGAPVPDQRP